MGPVTEGGILLTHVYLDLLNVFRVQHVDGALRVFYPANFSTKGITSAS
jgi:hypothetical protein